jgi:predicted PurR-regulated permease PerM
MAPPRKRKRSPRPPSGGASKRLRRLTVHGGRAAVAGGAEPVVDAVTTEERAEEDVQNLLDDETLATREDPVAATPGPALDRRSPFLIGLLAVLGGFAGYGIVLMLVKLSSIILYVVVALFLALGLDPIVARLVRTGLSRAWSVLTVVLGAAVVAALIGWLIIPPIVDQVTALIQAAPSYINDIQNNEWFRQLNNRWHISDKILHNVQSSVTQANATSVFGGVLGAGKAFADGVIAVFTVFVLTLYFLAAMPAVKSAAYKLVPQSRRPRVMFLSEEIAHRVGRYLLGQVCVAAINGIFSYVILVALGLPFPAVLATIIGLLALVPIVGTIVGGTIITLVALTNGWLTAVVVLCYYVAYHVVETYVLAPRIMSRAVEVPPAITIVAVLAGGTLLGIVGALIAIPVAAGLLLLYHQVAVPRQQRV